MVRSRVSPPPDDRADLGLEWTALELVCAGIATPERERQLGSLLLAPDLDWGELLDRALRHRMLTLLAYHVVASHLDKVPIRVGEHLRLVLRMNRHRRGLWYREAGRIVAALWDRGMTVAVRKGLCLESTVYEGEGSRWIGDIDLFVRPGDGVSVLAALGDLGFELGYVDWRTDEVTPFDRRQLLQYRVSPDHLPTCSRLLDDPLLPAIEVDFACSLTWTNAPYQVPPELVLDGLAVRPVPGQDGVLLPLMTPSFQLIDTALHLFKEAWFDAWLDLEQDVDLLKFGDVIRLWAAHRDALLLGGFRETLDRLGVVEPVAWVLEHMDRTFGTDATAALSLSGAVSGKWLASAFAGGGQLRTWAGDMRHRLQRRDRRSLFAACDPPARAGS
jgi:hypothetical protein